MAMSNAPSRPDTPPHAGGSNDVLRFIVCGPAGVGRSTLIQCLMRESLPVPDDVRSLPAAESGIDAALPVDVARRYFETGKRTFIAAVMPGDENWVRHMAAGASGTDLAVILADARDGILPETRRHASLLHLLGIHHVVLAINKMDLMDWWVEGFAVIQEDFVKFAEKLGIEHVTCIPLSALTGANISAGCEEEMPWYRGPTLAEYLETVRIDRRPATGFRLPIQSTGGPDAGSTGLSGTIASGSVAVGDRISVLPSHEDARISGLATDGGDVQAADAVDPVTVTLDRALDVSPGDILVAADDRGMEAADQLQAHLIWIGEEPLIAGRQYLIRIGAGTTGATVTGVKYTLDLATQAHIAAKTMVLNEIGVATLALDRPLAFDSYAANRATGSFILIERDSDATIAAGMIDHGLRRATNVVWHENVVNKQVRSALKDQKPLCLWFTGLSGAGKSTLANLVDERLAAENYHTYVLDGDNVRHGLNRDLGFTEEDRVENIRRVAEVAKLMVDAGLIVLVCAISPYRKDREMARGFFEAGEFVEIFVDTPLDECEARDPKGLYAKAGRGEIPNFTGISAPYESPASPEVHLNGMLPVEALAEQVFRKGVRRTGSGR